MRLAAFDRRAEAMLHLALQGADVGLSFFDTAAGKFPHERQHRGRAAFA